MNNKNFNKFVFSFLICAILSSNSISTGAEEINIEKINFELGVSCLKQNDYRQAIKYFELVIQKNPKNVEAHYNLALAYKKSGMIEKSISEYDGVVKLLNAPQNFQSKSIDINKIRQENRILHNNELASDKYELYSKVKSQENDYIDLGDMHYDSQQFETAVEYYNLALQINPYNDYTYFKIAKSYIDAEKYIQAEPYMAKAIELNPQNPKYTYYKDIVAKNIDSKYIKNVNLREKIVKQELNKKDPMQGFDLPEEYKRELFNDEEKNTAENTPEPYVAESNNSDKNPVKNETGIKKLKSHIEKKQNTNLNTTISDKKPEIKAVNQANFTQGKSQELDYLDLGDLHYDNQEYETAIEYYNLAVNINSNNDYTYYKLARCFMDMKQYQKANEQIDQALVLSSMNKKYLYFKNEISASLNPDENKVLTYKSPENFTKNRTNSTKNRVGNLNPNLKMIPNDPKFISEEESLVVNEPDVSDAKLPEKPVNNKKETNYNYAAIPNFFKNLSISALSPKLNNKQPLKQVQGDNPQVQGNNSKKQDNNSKKQDNNSQLQNNNNDTSGQQITSVITAPSVFGKDMKYYQAKEPEQDSTYKIPDDQYDKPMQEEVKELTYTPDYYNEKGIEYFKRDNMQKAENFFKKAIELKPMYAKAYNNLANVEVRRENLDKAIEYDLQALAIDPTYPEPYYNLALIYKKKKDFVNEIAYLDKAVQTDPKYYQAYFTRGLAYYDSGNYEQEKYNLKEV
jgi:tetratricopeptide (TPR) repeat protein